MVNIGVIVLNYMDYNMTINCIETFKKQNMDGFSVKIIVVDNHSNNNSYEVLKNKYKSDNLITVAAADRNLGFANGNNFGYRKLREYMNPHFVICSNSDILLEKDGLYKWIVNAMKSYHFGVLGPSIYSTTGKFYQNPIKNMSTDYHVLKHNYKEMIVSMMKVFIKKIMHIDTKREDIVDKWDNKYYKGVHSDLTLHGAFQVMSHAYFEHYSEPYDPGTFMYIEENILKVRCDSLKLPMIYLPDYEVLHLQAVSTNLLYGVSSNKDYMKLKNMLHSMRRYIEIINSLEKVSRRRN